MPSTPISSVTVSGVVAYPAAQISVDFEPRYWVFALSDDTSAAGVAELTYEIGGTAVHVRMTKGRTSEFQTVYDRVKQWTVRSPAGATVKVEWKAGY